VPAVQSMSSSRSDATSAQRSPSRRINMITARSRRPTGVEPSQAVSSIWTCVPVNGWGSPDSRQNATLGTASASAVWVIASACRNRSNDRSAHAVICADLRDITGSRAVKNAATSPAPTRPTRSTPAGHNTSSAKGPTQCT